ncbi:hypothetical protein ABZY58_11075 [Micromonospora tulbaghiae]|uniref:hypothetical protein n=1 Tax=Micromonospora tulbaghiae TaxID=479978 RepID=UPI0033AF25DE
MTVTPMTDYGRSIAPYYADNAVTCPKCAAGFARECQSTGGGNYATVPTHKARRARTAGWDDEQRQRFGEAVVLYRRQPWEAPADLVAEAETAATPIPTKTTSRPTPKGVRLSENQAEEIERAAENDGLTSCSTAHFHGHAAHRQTILSLHAKGILAEGDLFNHGYDRAYSLTDYGWQVWAHHRLIIRREPAISRWAATNQQERR